MEHLPERDMEPPDGPRCCECYECGGTYDYDDTRDVDGYGKRVCIWCKDMERTK